MYINYHIDALSTKSMDITLINHTFNKFIIKYYECSMKNNYKSIFLPSIDI